MIVRRRSVTSGSTTRAATRISVAVVFLLALPLGCAFFAMAPEKLPTEPIAFVHWDAVDGRKRAGIFENAGNLPPVPPYKDLPPRERELDVRAYLRGEESLLLQDRLARYPGRVKLYWPRTGTVEQIDAVPIGSLPLAWSNDRKRLLLASSHRGGREQLYEYHLERKDLSPVTFGSDEHPRGDYAGDGRIAVQRIRRIGNAGESESSVHLSRVGGQLGSPIALGVHAGTLRITQDAQWLVYEQIRPRPRRDEKGAYDSTIATRRIGEGTEEQLLSKGREPTLSPDGQWIVFASASSAGYRLRRMRLDGTSRVSISPGGTEERMPSVSPDGEYVVFVQRINGRRILTLRRFDGKAEKRAVSEGWSEFPVW